MLITKVCLNESFIGMISIGKLVVPEVEKERIKAVAEALWEGELHLSRSWMKKRRMAQAVELPHRGHI